MTRVTVTVDDAHRRTISTLARSLADKGMQVDRVMETMGCITGSIPSGTATAVATTLRNVPGVLSVDPDVAYRVAPPDSDVQ